VRAPILFALALAPLMGLYMYGGVGLAPAHTVARQTRTPVDTNGSRVRLTLKQRREAAGWGGFEVLPQSFLQIRKPMHHGEFLWNEEGVPPGQVSIRVDLRTQILSVFRSGHEIGTAVILYGAESKETPVGRFPILWKAKDHRSSLYDAPMPFTLRLSGDGVAIHGSNVRLGTATHGCVGVPTKFARELYDEVSVGDVVNILRSQPQS